MNEPSKIEKKVLSNVNEKKILVDRSRIIGALAVCGLPVMLISGMVFDDPGSENYIGAWIAFSILISFTPICILSLIVSWVLFWAGKTKISSKIVLFPFSIVVLVACFVVYAFASEFIFPMLKS